MIKRNDSKIEYIQKASINDETCEADNGFYEASISVGTHGRAIIVYGVNADICARRAVVIVDALNNMGVA